ncbi:MAG TPA: alpha/beta fold hydrolase [Oligoflexus sp.]|uniref:alpha/beta fold hydrolase n=1 Tax=Oligoflexus sp. TaxID=1971216 RepID=UPI002D2BA959|nr:alpha/beta fold hydrolase [Oligoflexus sp.]HYX32066.1 alpha/beta fold hydrolase [Oligoflexus sp.]
MVTGRRIDRKFLLLGALLLSPWAFIEPAALGAAPPVKEPVECQLKSGEWAQCLRLDVPENRARQGGRTISLYTAIFKAQTASKERPPIYMLAGGPGQSATEGFLPLPETFRRLRRHHDIILIDQRGTGESHPLRCTQATDPKWELIFNEDLAMDHSKKCVERLRADTDLIAYTTDAAAHDMEAVRQALGHEKIITFGVSYGTRLALRYLALYPDAVDKQILEGVLPPDVNFIREKQAFVESLQGLAALCRKDADCQRWGDPWDHVQKLKAAWSARPKARVMDPRSGVMKDVTLRADLLESMLNALLYHPIDMSIVPRILYEAQSGNLAPLLAKALGTDFGVYDGLYYLLLCAEDVRDLGTPVTDTQKTIASMCRLLPDTTLPADFRKQPVSQVPTLLLSGGLDPVTPPRYVASLKTSLPQQTHLVLSDYGHNISYVSCIQDAMIDFVDSNKPTLEQPACLKKMKGLHFFKGAPNP